MRLRLHGALVALAFLSSAPLIAAPDDNHAVFKGPSGQPVFVPYYIPMDSTGNTIGGTVTGTDNSSTIATGGADQTAIALNASRKGWCVQNPPDATETMNVRVGAAATTSTGVKLAAGQQACNAPGLVDTRAVHVIAATTGHAYLATEWQ